MKRYAAVCAFLLLAACNGSQEPDWSRVPQNQRVAIEDAVKAKDCERMQTLFDSSKRADVLEYLDEQMRDNKCY